MSRATDAAIATIAGLAATVPAVALFHDLVPTHPTPTTSWVVTAVTLALMTVLVGRPVAGRAARTGRARALGALAGATLATAWIAAPAVGLLRSDVPPAATLAWTLGEEDNAQVIGVAREVIRWGPGGGDLAEQFGTGFVVVATTAMRMLGLGADGADPRILAIGAFTLSVVAAIVLLGAAMGLLAVLGPPQPGPPGRRRGRAVEGLLVGAAVAIAITAAQGVAVVMPMRTGFLSFVWAFVWAALGLALLPLLLERTSLATTAAVVVHVVSSVLLLVRAWPFLIAVFAPVAILAVRRVPWGRIRRAATRRPSVALGVALLAATVVVVLARPLLTTGALAEVLSYGRDAFTDRASGIAFDGWIVAATLVAATILLVGVLPRGGGGDGAPARRIERAVVLLGPTAGVLGSWLVLRGVAEIVAGGEFNYAGTKLMYGVVAVGAVTLLPTAAAARAGRTRTSMALGITTTAALLMLAVLSPTARTVDEWAGRLAPAEPPHALAMIEAIDRTTPDLPVRCRPARGTQVTPTSQWAAYFCVRWVEDALNEDRQQAYRDDFLGAPDGTFDPIVAEATAEGLYGFAYVMDVGPGWFGWDGRS